MQFKVIGFFSKKITITFSNSYSFKVDLEAILTKCNYTIYRTFKVWICFWFLNNYNRTKNRNHPTVIFRPLIQTNFFRPNVLSTIFWHPRMLLNLKTFSNKTWKRKYIIVSHWIKKSGFQASIWYSWIRLKDHNAKDHCLRHVNELKTL